MCLLLNWKNCKSLEYNEINKIKKCFGPEKKEKLSFENLFFYR